jgi:hypothetical protein
MFNTHSPYLPIPGQATVASYDVADQLISLLIHTMTSCILNGVSLSQLLLMTHLPSQSSTSAVG